MICKDVIFYRSCGIFDKGKFIDLVVVFWYFFKINCVFERYEKDSVFFVGYDIVERCR